MMRVLVDREPTCDERQPGKSGNEEQGRSPSGSNNNRVEASMSVITNEITNLVFSVNTLEMTSPNPEPKDAPQLKVANANVLSLLPTSNVCASTPNPAGIPAAIPMPCKALITSKLISPFANPHPTDQMATHAAPARKVRRRPWTSATRPKRRRKHPDVRE